MSRNIKIQTTPSGFSLWGKKQVTMHLEQNVYFNDDSMYTSVFLPKMRHFLYTAFMLLSAAHCVLAKVIFFDVFIF